ncbi:PREDICTED: uncharacterized protein LOC109216822 [Nicotiana attenuata]|uniref:uncharacterized protein LOC109216822 n=1 Tax=Nicotiana attenuata TaxID=49451 RepID=UPI000904F67B|nr:PREDICTED: uncharacterized protein LOC109216822 [Nicotiana attenuata]
MTLNNDSAEHSGALIVPALDLFHPLYLHPSDIPGTMLVSVPFSGTGFGDWKEWMLISLSAMNKVQLIDGSLIHPTTNSPLYPHWQRCNNMVKSWIMNSLSKDIAKTILYYKTAREAWNNHIERYGVANISQYYSLQQSISSTSQGLNETYSTVKSNILMMSPVPSVEKAYSILIRDEKQREINSASQPFSSDSTSFIANSNSNSTHNQPNTTRKYTQRFTKGRKAAACVQIESSEQTSTKPDSPQNEDIPHGFSKEQYVHLMSLFHQMQASSTNQQSTSQESPIYANFAGPSLKRPLEIGKVEHGLDVTFAEHIFLSNSPPSGFFPSSTSSFSEHIIPNNVTTSTSSPLQSSDLVPTVSSRLYSSSHSPEPDSVPSPTPLPPLSSLPLRRFSRPTTVPHHLQDYICYAVPPTSFPDPSTFSQPLKSYTLFEPSFYHQAASNPAWQEAMLKEFQALESNQTWDIVPLPPGKKAIPSKWVYKVKQRSDGSIDRYKARLVIRGDNQQAGGIDYFETFSPVIKFTTTKCLLALAAKFSWSIYQLDVNNAFLHGNLSEEVYMKIPLGLTVSSSSSGPPLVCKLKKSLYGLKQASRQWFAKLSTAVTSLGLPSLLLLLVIPDASTYRRLIGKLNFLQHTRPDISFSVLHLSQFLHAPTSAHMQATLHVLRYLVRDPARGVLLNNHKDFSLIAYSDSDWAGCPSSRRSVSGYYVALAAEYRALRKIVAELKWLVRLLADLGISISAPIPLYCDNRSAISIAKNLVSHEQTKHIELDCHFVREKLASGLIFLHYVPTASQLADILTKPLTGLQHQLLLSKLGVLSPSSLRGSVGLKELNGPIPTGPKIAEEEIDPGPNT